MDRVYLRVHLPEGRQVVVQDPERVTIVQEVRGDGVLGAPDATLLSDEVRRTVTLVEVMAGGETAPSVLTTFASWREWQEYGAGTARAMYRVPMWLLAWLTRLARDASPGSGDVATTRQQIVGALLLAGLREGWGAEPLAMQLGLRDERTLVVWNYRYAEGQAGLVQEKMAGDLYRDLSPAEVAAALPQVLTATLLAGTPPVVLSRFSGTDWHAQASRTRSDAPWLPRWLLWGIDQRRKDERRSRQAFIERWLVRGVTAHLRQQQLDPVVEEPDHAR